MLPPPLTVLGESALSSQGAPTPSESLRAHLVNPTAYDLAPGSQRFHAHYLPDWNLQRMAKANPAFTWSLYPLCRLQVTQKENAPDFQAI